MAESQMITSTAEGALGISGRGSPQGLTLSSATSAAQHVDGAGVVVFRARAITRRRLHLPHALIRYVLTPIALLAAWQLVSTIGLVSTQTVSSPILVARAAASLSASGALWSDIGVSVKRMGIGLAFGLIAGTILGTTAGLWRITESVVDSPMQILNTVPFLALVPLFIMWFGIGELSKVILIALASAVPLYFNLLNGIRNVDVRLIEMARTRGVRGWRLVWAVLLPGAMPAAMVGLRFAFAFTVLALVAAEQISASSGIGYLMANAQAFFRTDEVFLCLVIYASFGLLGSAVVTAIEHFCLRWRPNFTGQ